MLQRELNVAGSRCQLSGDAEYLGRMGEAFEPATTALLQALCGHDNHVIDVGANIGLTALALAKGCAAASVLAVEPVPNTYQYLAANIADNAAAGTVRCLNVGLGAKESRISMYVNDDNLATSFVLGYDDTGDGTIPVTTLDALLAELQQTRVDFIKIDVEGFEMEVLKGARDTLATHKPLVLLEMNHWCLNIFHRIALPDFKDFLLATFPFVFAVSEDRYLDFSDPDSAGTIMEKHVFQGQFMDIVAGFDREMMTAKLDAYVSKRDTVTAPEVPAAEAPPEPVVESPASQVDHDRLAQLEQQLADRDHELARMQHSLSWRLTAPLRALNALRK